MQFFRFKTFFFLLLIAVLQWAPEVQSQSATLSVKPTSKPSSKATTKPTAAPVHIYGNKPAVFLSDKAQQGVVGALTIVLFILMAMEFLAPEALFLIALMIVTGCQIITLPQAFAGFSNAALVTIGALFLVIGGVEKSHAVDYLARKAFGATGSLLFGKCRIYITCFALSIFFNNTPLVAILLPVLKDWGRMRKVPASQLLIPLSYSVLAGSFVSMIGTSTNLTLDGLMQADRGYSFPFFAPAPIGIPLFFVLLIYELLLGPYLLPNRSGLFREANEGAEKLIAEVYVSRDSAFVGKSISHMMNSLGLAPSLAIKIRRKNLSSTTSNNGDIEGGASERMKKTLSVHFDDMRKSLSDVNYLKRISGLYPITKPDNTFNTSGSSSLINNNHGSSLELTSIDHSDCEHGFSGSDSLEYFDIVAPTFHEIIVSEDVVFIANAQVAVEMLMKSVAGESKGLTVLQSNAQELPGYGTQMAELVISDSNPFLGRTINTIAGEFAEIYDAAIVTVRGKEWGHIDGVKSAAVEVSTDSPAMSSIDEIEQHHHDEHENELKDGNSSSCSSSCCCCISPSFSKIFVARAIMENDEDKDIKQDIDVTVLLPTNSISDHILGYGDTVLVVTTEKNVPDLRASRDFFVVSTVGELPLPMTLYTFIPVLVFFAMLVLAATDTLDIAAGSMMVAALFFLGGWIKAEEIPKMIDLRLLMLIGTSLSFATSMTASGLALEIASGIDKANPTPFAALLLIYVITLLITELISNNAAAALMYPIAVALADQLLVDFKPFAMAVLVASTAGFMSPIGYQTHIMVWAPGGYRFWDFVVFGFFPDIIYWILGCAIIKAVFPF